MKDMRKRSGPWQNMPKNSTVKNEKPTYKDKLMFSTGNVQNIAISYSSLSVSGLIRLGSTY